MAKKESVKNPASNNVFEYDYAMSLYMGMVTISVMDAINEEFPEAYPEKRLCLGGWEEEMGISYMNLTRSGTLENEKISNRKPYLA